MFPPLTLPASQISSSIRKDSSVSQSQEKTVLSSHSLSGDALQLYKPIGPLIQTQRVKTPHSLRFKGKQDEALLNAAERGDVNGLRNALDAGANIHAKKAEGGFFETRDPKNQAIHLASKSGNLEALKLLVNRGANLNSEGYIEHAGRYPLMKAISSGTGLETINFLLERGANPNVEDFRLPAGMSTSLNMAIGNRNEPLIKLLLKFNAKPSYRDKDFIESMNAREAQLQKEAQLQQEAASRKQKVLELETGTNKLEDAVAEKEEAIRNKSRERQRLVKELENAQTIITERDSEIRDRSQDRRELEQSFNEKVNEEITLRHQRSQELRQAKTAFQRAKDDITEQLHDERKQAQEREQQLQATLDHEKQQIQREKEQTHAAERARSEDRNNKIASLGNQNSALENQLKETTLTANQEIKKLIEVRKKRSQELREQATTQLASAESQFQTEKSQINEEHRGRLRTKEEELEKLARAKSALAKEKSTLRKANASLEVRTNLKDAEMRRRSLDRQERSKERVALRTEIQNLAQTIKDEKRRIKIEKTMNRYQSDDLLNHKEKIARLEVKLDEANQRLRTARKNGLVGDWIAEVARSRAGDTDQAQRDSNRVQFDMNQDQLTENRPIHELEGSAPPSELEGSLPSELNSLASSQNLASSNTRTNANISGDTAVNTSSSEASREFSRALRQLEREQSLEGSTARRSPVRAVRIDPDSQSQAASEATSITSSFGRRSRLKAGWQSVTSKAKSIFNKEESSSEEGDLASSTESDKRFKRTARRRTTEEELNPTSELLPGKTLHFETDSLSGTESEFGPETDPNELRRANKASRKQGQYSLIDAVVDKNMAAAERMLRSDPNAVFQTNEDGENAMHMAQLLDEPGFATLFLQSQKDKKQASALANKKTAYGRSPLMLSSAQGHWKAGDALLTHPHSQINFADIQGTEEFTNNQNAFHIALQTGHSRSAQRMLSQLPEKDKPLFNKPDVHGMIPPMYAAANGLHRPLRKILQWKDLNTLARDHSERTLLTHAAEYGIKTANDKKRKTKLKAAFRGVNWLLKGKAEGLKLTLDAHGDREVMSPASLILSKSPRSVAERLFSFHFNPNQSVRNPKSNNTHTTPLLTIAENGNEEAYDVAVKDPRVKRRIKAERSGMDVMKIAAEYDQGEIAGRHLADEFPLGKKKPTRLWKKTRKGRNAIQIGFQTASPSFLDSVQKAKPDLTIKYTQKDIDIAQKKATPKKFTALSKVLRKAKKV